MNRDTRAAWSYHDATKHSVERLQTQQHFLDWEIKPLPFKVFPHLEPIPLPRELPPSNVPALVALTRSSPPPVGAPKVPTLAGLARLLHFSAGITRKRVYPGGQEHYFRAAACTGALYHIDVYVVCGDLSGLPAGVYHFGPHNFALHRLRAGDHRSVLIEATAAEPSLRSAPVVLAFASTYWRNSWKYQARAYRHCFWDSGTVVANLLAVAAADELPARVVTGFVDDTVNILLGLDPDREAPLALVALGCVPGESIPPPPPLSAVAPETLPLSSREVDYPAIRRMQSSSELPTGESVGEWRAAPLASVPAPAPGAGAIALPTFDPSEVPSETIDSVIMRRGSTRRFAQREMSAAELSAILVAATSGVDADYGASPTDVYVIVNAVEGLQPGAYCYHRGAGALELLRAGDFRRVAGHLGLGQELPADASVNLYFLCDLGPVLTRFGNRGYRVAQLDAAIAGGKAYLATYALRLGATGLTFFDDAVTDFFSPHAQGKSVMFLIAVGRGHKPLPVVQ